MNDKRFRIGNEFNISIKDYAEAKNIFLKNTNQKKGFYNEEQIRQELKEKKGARPVIILWSNKNFNKIICCSLSTSKTKSNEKYAFSILSNKNKLVFWKYEALILDKTIIKIIDNKIWKNHNKIELDAFFNGYNNSTFSKVKISNLYFKKTIKDFEDQINFKQNKKTF